MGQIAKTTQTQALSKQPQTIKDFIKVYQKEVAKALPKVMTPERFTRIVTTALTTTPKLAECTPQSFIGSMMQAAQLGLEPNTPLGQAYLIPYGAQCQFQLGYKGMIELAHRSGEVKSIEAHVVHEGDEFDFEYGLEARLRHKPSMMTGGAPVWVYGIVHFKDGGYAFEVMSYEECMAHGKKYSKTFRNGPWQTEPEEMAKKTVLKKVLKYAPMKTDFVTFDENSYDFNTDSGDINVIPAEGRIIEEDVQESIGVDAQTGEVISE